MRFLAFAFVLLLTACAATPPPVPVAAPGVVPAALSGALIGAGASALIGRFGVPQFQVREGPGLKLQWSSGSCILDVYLYRPVDGAGAEQAVLADARRPDGSVTDAAACAGTIGVGG